MDMQAAKIVFQMETTGTAAALKNFDQIKNKLERIHTESTTTFSRMSDKISQAGRNMQWLGQRVTFGLSLPIALFAKNSYDAFLKVEESTIKLRKIWDGAENDINEKLIPAAKRMSKTYGKEISDVISVMTEFAKSGIETAGAIDELTDITSKISLLFDTDMQTTMEAVRAVMFGYQLSVEDTTKAMEAMNIIADKTAADEAGILDFLSIMGGLGRSVGIDIRELAASAAVFSANAISASEGANALKFVIQRIQNPTDKAASLMKIFNIDLENSGFRTKKASEQFEILAKKFVEVKNKGGEAEGQFRTLIEADFIRALGETAGKRQANRLLVYLEDLGRQFDDNTDTISQYYTALEVSTDETENAAYASKELAKVMESPAHQWKQFTQELNLAKIEIGAKLIPVMRELIRYVTRMADWFLRLNPQVQDFAIKVGLLLVALGPMLSTLGSIIQVGGGFLRIMAAISSGASILATNLALTSAATLGLGGAVAATGSTIATVVAFMTGPWGLAIMATIAAISGLIWYLTQQKQKTYELKDAIQELITKKREYEDNELQIKELELRSIQLKEELAEKQRIYNETLAKFGPNSQEARKALLEVEITEGNINKNTRDSNDALEKQKELFRDLTPFDNFANSLKNISDKGNTAADSILRLKTESEKKYTPFIFSAESIEGLKGFQQKVNSGAQNKHFGGLIHASNGAIIPGASPLRDRVPVMAEPGEGIMSRQAIENLLKNGSFPSQPGNTYNINFNPGVMIATPGEQRTFARQIKKLIEQDNSRYAQPGPIFKGLTA